MGSETSGAMVRPLGMGCETLLAMMTPEGWGTVIAQGWVTVNQGRPRGLVSDKQPCCMSGCALCCLLPRSLNRQRWGC